jgi:Tol biopolymer transport system component
MGEVYRARDSKLDRDVALKILPESFAHDPERLTRFEREAKTLAALNHTHIAQIYGLEQSVLGSALIMELVDGEDLAARIARGPIPMEDALPIARQIAQALEAAHESGIVHRDLKPANIKVRADGLVKVLDFGLARLSVIGPTEAASASSAAAVVTSPAMTMQGAILGTAAYMPPEQAKGKPVDRRADIWAFGCVLFEMLTGRRAFEGEDVTDTIASVVSKEPEWSCLPPTTPPPVRLLLRRCLEKNASQRLPHIGVARLELDDSTLTMPGGAPSRRAPTGRWMVAAVPIVLAIGIGAGWWAASRLTSSQAAAAYRASLVFLPREASLSLVAPTARFAISPDGTKLAFVGTTDGVNRLWLRSLTDLTARALADVRGGSGGAPFWSPDGTRVAFFSNGQLQWVDIAGGAPAPIAESTAFRQQMAPGTWNADGVIVVSRGATLARVPSKGGALEPLTTLDTSAGETHHAYPHFLPDGQHVLYTAYRAFTPVAVYAIRLDRPSERQKVMDGGSNVQYADRALLYLRGTALVAQPFDPSRRALSGEPAVVVDSVLTNIALPFAGAFSASRTGALVHQGTGGQGLDTPYAATALVWRTPSGATHSLIDEPETYRSLSIAPDGRRALVTRFDERGRSDLWMMDLARGVRTRVSLTIQTSQLSGAVWSGDGTSFVVNVAKAQSFDLYRKPADSTSAEELLLADDRPKTPLSMSRDGRFLLFDTIGS